jgi:hypothetical protein
MSCGKFMDLQFMVQRFTTRIACRRAAGCGGRTFRRFGNVTPVTFRQDVAAIAVQRFGSNELQIDAAQRAPQVFMNLVGIHRVAAQQIVAG